MNEPKTHEASKLHGSALRPLKWGRVVLHVAGGLLVLALYLTSLDHQDILWLSGMMLSSLVSVDLLRWRFEGFNRFIFSQLGNFTQPHEQFHFTSATWFWVAMFLVALLNHPITFIATLTILSVADQAASLIGRRFGTIPLIAGRSLQGTVAFVLAGTAGASLALISSATPISGTDALLVSFGASLTGAFAELGSERLDDNLSIGVVSGSTAFLLASLLQLG